MRPGLIGWDPGRPDDRTLTLHEIYDVSTYEEARISVRHVTLAGRKKVAMVSVKADTGPTERPCPLCGNLMGLCPCTAKTILMGYRV